MTDTKWNASDISEAIELRSQYLEFQDASGEWHLFTIIATPDRIVFGGVCNTGFIESGYYDREGFGLDECLQETAEELEVYYNEGPEYASYIVCNDRM